MAVTRVFGPQHVSGTGEGWHTSCLAAQLGAQTTDNLVVFARVESPGGTDPSLTIELQDSPDGIEFASVEKLLDDESIGTAGLLRAAATKTFGSISTLAISLGGLTPEAVLTVWIDVKPNVTQQRSQTIR